MPTHSAGLAHKHGSISFILSARCQRHRLSCVFLFCGCFLSMAPRESYLENKAKKIGALRPVVQRETRRDEYFIAHRYTGFYRLLSYIRKVDRSLRRNDFPLHRLARRAPMDVIGVHHSWISYNGFKWQFIRNRAWMINIKTAINFLRQVSRSRNRRKTKLIIFNHGPFVREIEMIKRCTQRNKLSRFNLCCHRKLSHGRLPSDVEGSVRGILARTLFGSAISTFFPHPSRTIRTRSFFFFNCQTERVPRTTFYVLEKFLTFLW